MNQDPLYQPQTNPRSKKLLFAAIALLALMLIAVGVFALTRPGSSACLTPDDYAAFYGEAAYESQFEPTVSFYQNDYDFLPGTSTLNTAESDSPTIDAGNLARFYNARTEKPMIFTVAAVYRKGDDASKKLANQRATSITSTLTQAGIPTELVQSSVTGYTLGDIDSDLPDAADSVSLTLASTESCSQ